jgi:hypothetical protein
MARWSLTARREKLVSIGAELTRHARRLILQVAEVALTRDLFARILSRVRLLSPVPASGPACVAVVAGNPVVFADPRARSLLHPAARAAADLPARKK